MARTTSDAVKELLAPGKDYDLVREPSLIPFIETASAMVDDVVVCAAAKEAPINSTRAELIERWLAAHFYLQSDQPYTSKSTAGSSASFQGQTGMYLEGTKYGQTAARLDRTGCLAAVASGTLKIARATWVGKTVSEQTNFWDRQ